MLTWGSNIRGQVPVPPWPEGGKTVRGEESSECGRGREALKDGGPEGGRSWRGEALKEGGLAGWEALKVGGTVSHDIGGVVRGYGT